MENISEDGLNLLNEVVRDVLGRKDINLDLKMTALDVDGWDSLKHVQILYQCEEKLNVRFTLQEIGSLNSVGDLVKIINKSLKK